MVRFELALAGLYLLTGLVPLLPIGVARQQWNKPGAKGLFVTKPLVANVVWNVRVTESEAGGTRFESPGLDREANP